MHALPQSVHMNVSGRCASLPAAALMLMFGWQTLSPSTAYGSGHEAHGAGHDAKPAMATATGLPRSASPEGATVYFITPTNGDKTGPGVVVRFGLGRMGVAPAGVEKVGTGHHHLLIDADLPKLGLPVPKSANYRHFGKGQTEVALSLKPGTHTLQLLLGDHLHIPHDPPVMSERITITVTEAP